MVAERRPIEAEGSRGRLEEGWKKPGKAGEDREKAGNGRGKAGGKARGRLGRPFLISL